MERNEIADIYLNGFVINSVERNPGESTEAFQQRVLDRAWKLRDIVEAGAEREEKNYIYIQIPEHKPIPWLLDDTANKSLREIIDILKSKNHVPDDFNIDDYIVLQRDKVSYDEGFILSQSDNGKIFEHTLCNMVQKFKVAGITEFEHLSLKQALIQNKVHWIGEPQHHEAVHEETDTPKKEKFSLINDSEVRLNQTILDHSIDEYANTDTVYLFIKKTLKSYAESYCTLIHHS